MRDDTMAAKTKIQVRSTTEQIVSCMVWDRFAIKHDGSIEKVKRGRFGRLLIFVHDNGAWGIYIRKTTSGKTRTLITSGMSRDVKSARRDAMTSLLSMCEPAAHSRGDKE